MIKILLPRVVHVSITGQEKCEYNDGEVMVMVGLQTQWGGGRTGRDRGLVGDREGDDVRKGAV